MNDNAIFAYINVYLAMAVLKIKDYKTRVSCNLAARDVTRSNAYIILLFRPRILLRSKVRIKTLYKILTLMHIMYDIPPPYDIYRKGFKRRYNLSRHWA